MLFNFQKPVTKLLLMMSQRCFEKDEKKHVLHWPPASKSHQRLQASAAHRIHLPAGWCVSTNCAQCTESDSTQNWLQANCPDFITKNQWPPSSPDLNSVVDYHIRMQCWRLTASLKQSRKQLPNSRRCFKLSDATCHKN